MADIDLLPTRGVPFAALVDSTGVATNGSSTVAQLAAKGMRAICAVDATGVSVGGANVAQLASAGIRAFCPVDENGVAQDSSTADMLRTRGIRPMVLLNATGIALTGSSTMLALAGRGLQCVCPLDETGNATTMGPVILLSNSTIQDNATVGTNVGVLSVAGGSGTYTFTLTSNPGNLFVTAGTNGVNLNTNAAMTVGTYPITVQAAGGVPTPITRTLSIAVTPHLAAPVNTAPPAISGTTTVGQTLTITGNTWTGFPTPTYAYQWNRGGSAISGATASSYLLVTADGGATITVTVTATNSSGNASATSAGVGPIAALPTAPANTVLPAITGTTTVGQTLTTSNGTWTGTPTITYAYQWLRNGANISGATASTYLLVSADATTNVSVTVTATNGVGNASATAAAVGPITSGPSEDPATTAWVNAVIAAGGTVSTAQRGYVDTLIKAYKTAGVWTLLDHEWLFAAENKTQAKIDIVGLLQWSEPMAPMTFTAGRGLKEGGFGGHLDLGVMPSNGVTFQQNSASFGVYVLTNRTTPNDAAAMGAADGGSGSYCFLRALNTGGAEHDLNSSNFNSPANPTAMGNYIISRTSSTALTPYKNNAAMGATETTMTALARPAVFWAAFTFNTVGGASSNVVGDEMASVFIGGGMNSTQALAKNAALNAYMTSVGCNVY